MDLQIRIITIKYKKCDNVRTNVTVKRVHITTVAMESNNCYIIRVCVLSLIQHVTRMCHIILPSVACPTIQTFPYFLIRGTH